MSLAVGPKIVRPPVWIFICAILGALEILDNNQWINRLKGSVDVSTLRLTGKIEIALAAVLVLFAIAFALPSYKLTKQLGWTRYKKIGADLAIDSAYEAKEMPLDNSEI